MNRIQANGNMIMTAALLALAFFGMSVHAAEGDIGPVHLDSVGVLQLASGGHRAGNMEIKIRGGFMRPPGLGCDSMHITTLKSTDPDRRMLTLLTAAHLTGKTVRLRITDDPALNAFDGRCSLMWVGVDP